jgi:PhzF family phenazine biosynthesis protein
MAPLYWIDAFSDGPFTGNPAAVCILEAPPEESWMRSLAAELGLSETAFVQPLGEGRFKLRWLTPKSEVKLCGHATLATAAALLDCGLARPDEAMRFDTLSGELRAWKRRNDGLLELDFPAREAMPEAPPEGLLAALGLMTAVATARAGEDWLLECREEEELRTLHPDFKELAKIPARGVCVSCRPEEGAADFVSRFFAPSVGVDEDPVTGSAHCYLGPWWAAKLGSTELLGRQLSRRGGLIQVSLKNGRAFLSGSAKILIKGSIY